MAGAGYKNFSTGDVLTATDLNTYAVEQSVMVFATSTARDTALASAKAEGMFAFLKDSDSLTYYDGSSWIVVDLAGDVTGVTAGSGLAGGGTSGTVTLTVDTDAKGDLIVGTGADAATKLSVGTNTYVLTADSSTASGLTWSAPTTGDITGVTAGTNIGGGGTSGSVTVNLAIDAAVDVGADGSGVDMTWHSATSGDYAMWDASEEKLIIEGTNGATALDVTDGNVVIGDGTLTIGSDGAGEDVVFYSDTAGDNFTWDSSAKKLIITGTDSSTALDVADGNVSITDGLTVTGTTALSTTGFGDATVSKAMMKDYSETTNAIGATSASEAIDLEAGNVVTATLSVATTTFTFSNPIASDDCSSFTLILTQDGSGSRAVTWPGAVDWAGGTAPTLTTTAAGKDIFTFLTVDAGTTWYGFTAGQAMG